ncbi:MAG TPA: DUF4363 family protein [Spirochaetia bacterium]|nr:DUF4363 family protein [Spirochaetia bacterium]
MKLVWAVLAVFAVIVSLGFWADYSLNASIGRLLQNVDLTAQALKSNQWDAAYGQSLQLETTWGQTTGWWPVVLDHGEIDIVRFDVGRLKEYIAGRNSALALGQVEELRLKLEHIPEKDAITLRNIL